MGDEVLWTRIVAFALKDWARISLVSTRTQEFTTSWTSWSWQWLTDGTLTAALVFNLNKHLALSARGDLDSWAHLLNALVDGWAAALGALDKTGSLKNFTLTTVNLWNLWTGNGVLVLSATVTWKHLVSWATLALFSVWFDLLDKLASLGNWSSLALGLLVWDNTALGGIADVGNAWLVAVLECLAKSSDFEVLVDTVLELFAALVNRAGWVLFILDELGDMASFTCLLWSVALIDWAAII